MAYSQCPIAAAKTGIQPQASARAVSLRLVDFILEGCHRLYLLSAATTNTGLMWRPPTNTEAPCHLVTQGIVDVPLPEMARRTSDSTKFYTNLQTAESMPSTSEELDASRKEGVLFRLRT